MKKNTLTTLLFLLCALYSFSQMDKEYKFGKLTDADKNLNVYKLDSTANAVVLFDSGITEFLYKNNNVIISTQYYIKIKFLDNTDFSRGTFEIPIYNNDRDEESIINIKGITHNGNVQTKLSEANIFKEKVDDNWKQVKFTMPNLEKGSIIEVEYTLETPFEFKLNSWYFQSDIPVVKSIYKASIPGNYIYNRNLSGFLKLTKNSSTIKTNCFSVPQYLGHSDCENIIYEVQNAPAYKEEAYMTSKKNFISKLEFELAEFRWFDGSIQKFTKSWKSVDNEFKNDNDFGKQLKKVSYFKSNLPKNFQYYKTDLEKAKAIYTYIQNYYTWNGKYNISKDVSVKEAYEKRTGNVSEINISLADALNAENLNAQLMLLSTRENGFATKMHPIITDFNYVIVKLKIGNTDYLLDATDKLIPFGMLPTRCLNSYGRVMDFDNGSYWMDIIPENNTKVKVFANLNLNEDGSISGKIRKAYFGYEAVERRKEIQNKSDDKIATELENDFNFVEISNYKVDNKDSINIPLIETFDILMPNETDAKTILLNPFFDIRFKSNPFIQKERLYPVDFGYQKNYTINFSLKLPENYNISSFPTDKALTLKNNSASFLLKVDNTNKSMINLVSSFSINKPIFYKFEYEPLKELFKQIINTEQTPIIIKEINNNQI